jgi:hypothetical protein
MFSFSSPSNYTMTARSSSVFRLPRIMVATLSAGALRRPSHVPSWHPLTPHVMSCRAAALPPSVAARPLLRAPSRPQPLPPAGGPSASSRGRVLTPAGQAAPRWPSPFSPRCAAAAPPWPCSDELDDPRYKMLVITELPLNHVISAD